MDAAQYQDTPFGGPASEPASGWNEVFYRPAHLPRDLTLAPATVSALSEADAALGYLRGLGQLLTDPQLLVRPYLAREAVSSSRIEGTQTTLDEVLRATAEGRPVNADVDEVERYLAATDVALDLLSTLPISRRLVSSVHAVLLSGVRGDNRRPGEFRTLPVFIGSAGDDLATAAFVPPLPALIDDLFADWERFVNEPSTLPVLIRCGLMHYQFETIHPFLDGNGRIGRLLIVLMLLAQTRLDHPLLYLSGFFEANRREYYERLQGVRERGDVDGWLRYFCVAVKQQADDAVQRARRLVTLRERYLGEAAGSRSSLVGLATLVFENPYVTVARVERATGLTNQGARNLIRRAEVVGWLQIDATRGASGRNVWVAQEVLSAIADS